MHDITVKTSFDSNFNEVHEARCSCGWSKTDSDPLVVRATWSRHLLFENYVSDDSTKEPSQPDHGLIGLKEITMDNGEQGIFNIVRYIANADGVPVSLITKTGGVINYNKVVQVEPLVVETEHVGGYIFGINRDGNRYVRVDCACGWESDRYYTIEDARMEHSRHAQESD